MFENIYLLLPIVSKTYFIFAFAFLNFKFLNYKSTKFNFKLILIILIIISFLFTSKWLYLNYLSINCRAQFINQTHYFCIQILCLI